MRTLRTVAEMRAHVAHARRAGRSIGLVPTMGAFHAGHHALMRAARERCDEVVVWLFVNPTQFNERSDLDSYPRDEATVERQRAALLERTPELAPLFDALADATRALARSGVAA